MGLSMGGDPEIFVVNKYSGNIITPDDFFKAIKKTYSQSAGASRKINIKKEGEYSIRYIQLGGALLKEDNSQLELQLSVRTCRDEFVLHIGFCIKELQKIINRININLKYNWKLSVTPTAQLTKKDHEKGSGLVNVFGCDPDISALSLIEKTPATNPMSTRDRSIGFHMHFGLKSIVKNSSLKEFQEEMNPRIVVAFDYFVANTLVFLEGEEYKEAVQKRRSQYGQAGSYRNPSHGLEYRTPNSIMLLSPVITHTMYAIARNIATIAAKKPKGWMTWFKKLPKLVDIDTIYEAINTHNVDLAFENYLKLKDHLCKIPKNNNFQCDIFQSNKKPYTIYKYMFDKLEYIKENGIDITNKYTKNIGDRWVSPRGIYLSFPLEGMDRGWLRTMPKKLKKDFPKYMLNKYKNDSQVRSDFIGDRKHLW